MKKTLDQRFIVALPHVLLSSVTLATKLRASSRAKTSGKHVAPGTVKVVLKRSKKEATSTSNKGIATRNRGIATLARSY